MQMFECNLIAGNLKSVIAKQETRCMELEKSSADNDSKKKKAVAEAKAIEEKLNKQESLVWAHKCTLIIHAFGWENDYVLNTFSMLFIDKAIRSCQIAKRDKCYTGERALR